MGKKIRTEEVDHLFEAILCLKNKEECYTFFEDVCTINELLSLSQRFEVAKMLTDKRTYLDISEKTGASTATISRVNRSLNYGNDGYEMVFSRMREKETEKKKKQNNMRKKRSLPVFGITERLLLDLLCFCHVGVYFRRDILDRIFCFLIILKITGKHTDHIGFLLIHDNGRVVFYLNRVLVCRHISCHTGGFDSGRKSFEELVLCSLLLKNRQHFFRGLLIYQRLSVNLCKDPAAVGGACKITRSGILRQSFCSHFCGGKSIVTAELVDCFNSLFKVIVSQKKHKLLRTGGIVFGDHFCQKSGFSFVS